MLPPLAWQGGSFYMSEFTFGDITAKYTKEGDRYFCEFAHYPAREATLPVIAQVDDIDRDFANRAFNGTSFDPEKRGQARREAYAEAVNGFYAELWPLVKTDDQKTLLAAEMERYREGYLNRMKAYLGSHSNVVSTMIAGPARF